MFKKGITAATIIYSLLLLALLVGGRAVAFPTEGGISPSEALEGMVPGGLATLLIFWLVLFCCTVGAWGLSFLSKKRRE